MEIYQIKKEYKSLNEKLINLANSSQLKEVKQELEELVLNSQKSGFWDEPETASLNMKKQNRFSSLISKVKSAEDKIEELELAFEFYDADEYDHSQLENDLNSVQTEIAELEILILLNGELDDSNVVIEINPGAGGTESQDWAQMLFDMYIKYFEKINFKYQVLNAQSGEVAGLKNAIIEVRGENAYGLLKNEQGIHRLVRISPFDSASRRHTSFAGVHINPLIEQEIDIVINDSDIKVDRFRSGGAGGQSVNTTDSAIRITHKESGIVVSCQNQRSQIQNLEKAMQILKSRLYELEIQKQNELKEAEEAKKTEIAWGHQKRSYILHPYKLIKDHVSKYETSQAEKVLNGDLEGFIYSNLIN